MIKKKKVTLIKSGLKSLLVEAEGGGWKRRGITWRQAHLHLTTMKTMAIVETTAKQQGRYSRLWRPLAEALHC